MGLFRNVTRLASKQNIDKAKRMAAENADKINDSVGKATDAIDKRTGGKHRDKLDKVEGAVARNLEQAKRDGDDPDEPGPGTSPAR